MDKLEKMITDKQLSDVFAYTNFGNTPKREVVKYALMNVACEHLNGHTAQCIINELGLCTKKTTLTKKGKEYLYAAFGGGTNYYEGKK